MNECSQARLPANGGAWTSPLLHAGVRSRPAHARPLSTASLTASTHTWYGLPPCGTARLPPRPGPDGTRCLRSPPLPIGFRAKSQGCLCCRRLCCTFQDACPYRPSSGARAGLSGLLTARRCPQAVGAAGDCEPGVGCTALGVGVGVVSPPGSPWPPLTGGRACVGWRGARRQLARAGWHFRSRAPLAVWRQNGPRPSHSSLVTRNLGVSSDFKVEQALGSPWGSLSWSSLRPSPCRQPGRAGSGQPAASEYPSARALRPPLPVPGPLEGVGPAWSPGVFWGGVSPRCPHATHPDGSLQRQMSPVGGRARPAQVCEPRLPLGAPSITSFG